MKHSPKGYVTVPLPPELIAESEALVSPKSPLEIERQQEEYFRQLRKAKGIDLA